LNPLQLRAVVSPDISPPPGPDRLELGEAAVQEALLGPARGPARAGAPPASPGVIPQAQFGPLIVPDEIPDRTAVLLADVLPTAWEAVQRASVPVGGTVVVYGLGPIGQMCCRIAGQQGADRVIGIDKVPDRLAEASEHGAEVVNYSVTDDVVADVKERTDGRGADSVIDAVGMDADGSFADTWLQRLKIQPDRMVALHQALGSVRRGGTVSVIGVYAGWMPSFPVGDLFDKQVTLRWGQANVRAWTTQLLEILATGDPISASDLVTHEVPLADAPQWYEAFRDKRPGVRKVVLTP
jgi:threonine dehydrogenase-like Zn-dependent dehydrogenase